MIFAVVVSEWNRDITDKLLEGVCKTFESHGVQSENIHVWKVPGSFELSFAAKVIAETHIDIDAIILLGCVIRGETPHFEYVCSSVTKGITDLNIRYDVPFIFGLLTTDTLEQAKDRAGGKYGNKGDEAAIIAIKMVNFNLMIREVN